MARDYVLYMIYILTLKKKETRDQLLSKVIEYLLGQIKNK